MRRLLLAVLLSSAASASAAWAQALTEPPPILQIVRKPGTSGVDMRRYAAAGAAIEVIGMNAITGLPETWVMESHQSFASIEDLDQSQSASAPVRQAIAGNRDSSALEDDILAPARTIIAMHRPAWSYRPDQAIRLFPKARYFEISIYRIRPGTEGDFGELVKLRRLASDTVNQDRPELAYQVVSGAPGGTFIFLAPIASLRTMDEGVAPLPVYAEGLAAARAKEAPKIAADSEISREHLLFRVNPAISHVSDDFAESDPAFWRGKK